MRMHARSIDFWHRRHRNARAWNVPHSSHLSARRQRCWHNTVTPHPSLGVPTAHTQTTRNGGHTCVARISRTRRYCCCCRVSDCKTHDTWEKESDLDTRAWRDHVYDCLPHYDDAGDDDDHVTWPYTSRRVIANNESGGNGDDFVKITHVAKMCSTVSLHSIAYVLYMARCNNTSNMCLWLIHPTIYIQHAMAYRSDISNDWKTAAVTKPPLTTYAPVYY